MQVNTSDFNNAATTGVIELSDDVFNIKSNEGVVHQVVTSIMSAARQGSKAQKTRSEVRGGGAKPFRQKGTGRARAGTIRSPIWRSGGRTFAAKPRDYSKKINKKEYALALKSVLSELLRQQRLQVYTNLVLDDHKTKNLANKLKQLELNDCLFVVADEDDNLTLASRNLKNIDVLHVRQINPYNLVSYQNVVISETAAKTISETNS